MFGYRTPAKKDMEANRDEGCSSPQTETEEAGPSAKNIDVTFKVRKSIGDWEAGRSEEKSLSPKTPVKTVPVAPSKQKLKVNLPQERKELLTRSASVEASSTSPKTGNPKYANRLAEAKACIIKAKLHLGNSRNLKTDIKAEVTHAIERLYQLVKEGEAERSSDKRAKAVEEQEPRIKDSGKDREDSELVKKLEEHGRQLEENRKEMEKLKEVIEKEQKTREEGITYASVVAGTPRRQHPETTAMHSVVITSKDEKDTGEQVFEMIRKAVNAKEEGVRIDKIRKGRDRKVIVGCNTQTEINRVKDRIQRAGTELNVEEVRNKDPLVIIRGVLQYNTDEDVLKALRSQNHHIFKDVSEENERVVVKYRRRARNPHMAHIVLSVSPIIWSRLTEVGTVHIDIQRLKVADQSPLIQCSRCLGFGHGKRICREDPVDLCSHCAGPHLKTKCPDWLAGVAPTCRNCLRAKLDHVGHDAFSSECPVRKRWDSMARSTVAYC